MLKNQVFTKLFIAIYCANFLLSLIPVGFISLNPFQNIFLADSYSYFCEIWRRAGIDSTEQDFWLHEISKIYSESSYDCKNLLGSYYPGAPIFSRIGFISLFQITVAFHPLIGPLFVHLLAQILLLALILNVFRRFDNSSNLKIGTILLFMNPSLVYPIFAFATEKYQLIALTLLYLTIEESRNIWENKKILFLSSLLIYFMSIRENIIWCIFFYAQYFVKYKESAKKAIASLLLISSFFLHFLQSKFASLNTPDYVLGLDGGRVFGEQAALRRVFSYELGSLLDRSLGADIRVMLTNFTVLDLVSIAFFVYITLCFVRNIRKLNDFMLIIGCITIGLFHSAVSAAFFLDRDIVTFFRLFLPSIWIILLIVTKNKLRVSLNDN